MQRASWKSAAALLSIGTMLAACGGGGGNGGPAAPPTAANIALSASPSSVIAAPCPPSSCGSLTGQMEATASLSLRETAGVGARIDQIAISLASDSGPIIASGAFDASGVATLAGGSNRVNANSALTVPRIGGHFPAASSAALPGTLTYTAHLTDDHNNVITLTASVRVTAS